MPNSESKKYLMDDLYRNPRFPDAVDLWASFFAKSREEIEYSNWRHLNHQRKVIEDTLWKNIIPGQAKILDIGCGKGFFLKRLQENFGERIDYFAGDLSEIVVNLAKGYYPEANYCVFNGEQLPFQDDSFDYIQIISTLQQVDDPTNIINEAYRTLKPNGHLYIVIHKNSLDPFLILDILSFIKRTFVKQHNNRYNLPLDQMRTNIFNALAKLNLKFIESKTLVSHVNVTIYRMIKIPMSFLMFVADLTNKLPFSTFKNLECYVYKKIMPDKPSHP